MKKVNAEGAAHESPFLLRKIEKEKHEASPSTGERQRAEIRLN